MVRSGAAERSIRCKIISRSTSAGSCGKRRSGRVRPRAILAAARNVSWQNDATRRKLQKGTPRVICRNEIRELALGCRTLCLTIGRGAERQNCKKTFERIPTFLAPISSTFCRCVMLIMTDLRQLAAHHSCSGGQRVSSRPIDKINSDMTWLVRSVQGKLVQSPT